MSSLEDFYQELDARMALSDNEDWRRFSSRRRQASHRTSGSTSLSHDDDSVSLPVATISPPPSTNEIGFMTSKRKASSPLPPQGFLESEQGADPLSSKKGGKHKTSSLPASSALASSEEKRKKVTISSVVLAAPAPIQDMPPATEDPTDVLGSSTAAKRDSSSKDAPLFKETSAVTAAPGNTARTGTGAASIGKRPKAPAITLMAKHSAVGGKGKGKKTKDKPELVTPAEFARRLLRQAAVAGPSETETETGSHNKARRAVKEAPSQYLKDYVIFYAGGDLTYASARTRGCMSYIHRHGGTVLPVFDPVTATHVVTETSQKMTLRALGLKSLSDIPLEIPTVKWSWVNSGKPIPGEKDKRQMDYEFMHAAFPSRMDAGRSFADSSRSRGKQKAGDDADQAVVIAPRQGPDEAAGRAESSSSRASSRSIGAEEPGVLPQDLRHRGRDAVSDLSEGKQVAGRSRRKSRSPSNEGKTRKKLKGFICDDPAATAAANASSCINQDIVDKLSELAELHRAKPTQEDKWRVFSYTKAIAALRKCKERIGSLEQARSLNGVGDKTAQKIMEIIETGALRRVDAERTEDVAVVQLFQGIYGVGQSIAYAWYFAGCRTLDDIRERKGGIKLTSIQELGLKYYDDINTRMSREEARAIFEEIRSIALCLDPKLFVEIMGSYRRGKSTCGDIDIMVTRPPDDGRTHAGILPKLLSALRSAGIITEDLLSLAPDATDSLEVTYRGLCIRPTKPGQESPSRSQIRRRIDILAIPWESRGAALIYFTGDDIFNRSLRLKANKMGYSLNQRGLFEGVVRSLEDRAIKTNAGNVIASETEEEIFRILGVPWIEAHERAVRG